MRLYTIGFMKKSARIFFEILRKNHVKRILDIRLRNTSQLSGFAKREDLRYFLDKIGNIGYVYLTQGAPTKDLLEASRKGLINWEGYQKRYIALLKERNILKNIDKSILKDACLLCSEPTPEKCHRRLLAEYLAHNNKITIIHL